MGVRVETGNGMPDQLKWLMTAILIAAGVAGFYFFDDQLLLFRVIGLLAVGAVAVVIAFQTEKGRETWVFMRDARIELRKVVWPTRNETVQTTLIVIAVVALLAIILWMLDGLLGWIMRLLLEQGA